MRDLNTDMGYGIILGGVTAASFAPLGKLGLLIAFGGLIVCAVCIIVLAVNHFYQEYQKPIKLRKAQQRLLDIAESTRIQAQREYEIYGRNHEK